MKPATVSRVTETGMSAAKAVVGTSVRSNKIINNFFIMLLGYS
jgi:hypothetical protein